MQESSFKNNRNSCVWVWYVQRYVLDKMNGSSEVLFLRAPYWIQITQLKFWWLHAPVAANRDSAGFFETKILYKSIEIWELKVYTPITPEAYTWKWTPVGKHLILYRNWDSSTMNDFTWWYICHHYHGFHSEQLHPLKDGSWKIAVGRRLSIWGKRPIVRGYVFVSGRVSHQIKTHLRWRVNTLPETHIEPKNDGFQ